ncbi:hypothetical protein GEMRC1_011569 [Eukaryota sp. GEM-RC1]
MESIQVVCRIRPLSAFELSNNASSIVDTPSSNLIRVHVNEEQSFDYSFHTVLPESTSQASVFSSCNIPQLLDLALQGYPCSILCYGQTSAGKTYTLFSPNNPSPADLGIIYRSLDYLNTIQSSSIRVSASFLEVYNDNVFDLLNDSAQVSLKFNSKRSEFYPSGAFVVDCMSLDDCFAVIQEGLGKRATGSHEVNVDSSRSHALLTLNFPDSGGKLTFVDLAGSEKVKRLILQA